MPNQVWLRPRKIRGGQERIGAAGHRMRGLPITFIAALAVGVVATAVAVVAAQTGGGGEDSKQEPVRDNPQPVQAADLPDGEHLTQLDAPRMHGRLLVFPPGQDPSVKVAGNPTADWTYTRHRTLDAARAAGLNVSPDALPSRYGVTGGSALEAHKPDGTSEFTEWGLEISGPGYPIHVVRAIPYHYFAGAPYDVAAPQDGTVMATLGNVRGIPAVFIHKRPGVETAELQQVIVDDGDRVVQVEGYVDDFETLITVAASVLENAGKGEDDDAP